MHPLVEQLADLHGDLAGTYRQAPMAGAREPDELLDAQLLALERDGWVICDSLLTVEELASIRAAAAPLLQHSGRNSFEGLQTQRVYSVLSKTRAADRLVDHPRVLALLDRILRPNYLLSQLQVINVLPGEVAQLLHPDDGIYPVARPRRALSAATIWAIDDFTPENGATLVIPGSHRWGDAQVPSAADTHVPLTMPAGSCAFFLGTLWHGAGANRSQQPRLALTAQYCEPWLRPQEAFTLSVPRPIAAGLSDDLRRMLGYSIHPPFVGMVDGRHPARLLSEEP
jgi:ectoine hydroxylase-related dioxygenase (phytanoyl-CoA dioxygenase family)